MTMPWSDSQPNPEDVGRFDDPTDPSGRFDDVEDISPDLMDGHITDAMLHKPCPICGAQTDRDGNETIPLPTVSMQDGEKRVPLWGTVKPQGVCFLCAETYRILLDKGPTSKEATATVIRYRGGDEA